MLLAAPQRESVATPEQAEELDLLMGGSGPRPRLRLGMGEDATADEHAQAALDALATWQAVERHPLSSRATQIAAAAATRTLEGLLAG